MSELVEHDPHVLEIGSLALGQVKAMTDNIDTPCFLAWQLVLIGQGKDWVAQCQDNVTEYDIGSPCWLSDFTVGQHYKAAMSANCHKLVSVMI